MTAAAGPGGLLADEPGCGRRVLSGFEQPHGARREVGGDGGPHGVSEYGGEVVEGREVEGRQSASQGGAVAVLQGAHGQFEIGGLGGVGHLRHLPFRPTGVRGRRGPAAR